MSRTNIIILVVVVMAALLVYALNKRGPKITTLEIDPTYFQVSDTAQVTKVFISKKAGDNFTLTREKAGWKLNGDFYVNKLNIDQLLEIFAKMRIKAPVGVQSQQAIVNDLSANHYKVELYNGQELLKIVYLGSATQDGLANYIYEEGIDMPYIVHIPGWNGNFRPRVDIIPNDWKRTQMFHYAPPSISEFTVNYELDAALSFTLKVDEDKKLHLFNLKGEELEVDSNKTNLLNQTLFQVNKVHYAEYLHNISDSRKDSIVNVLPKFGSLKVVGKGNKSTQVQLVFRPDPLSADGAISNVEF
ncbi:MAG: hypothetical protein KDC92_03625, partial [Bacteroidetes bacterium]|nr:hypothetical protein [Bacteroidota bacterium]